MKLINFAEWPLWSIATLLAAAIAVIAVAGTRLTHHAERLAGITGIGQALFGAVLLGGTTSLPGIVTSVSTAFQGYAELSVSNAIGGIAAQTSFLAIADITYRKANLEHAAASVENLVQTALLMTLLAIPLLAMSAPPVSVFGVHPASPLLLAAYGFGLHLVSKAKSTPLWKPQQTKETEIESEQQTGATTGEKIRLWVVFVSLGALVATAGFIVAQSGIALVQRTSLSETVVGMLFTAVGTSLPELVTTIAAVRRGALTLAVGGIIGGNSFDVLFVAFADIAYREGSLYHAITERQIFIIALTILLTGILLLGLLRREKSGIGNIGFESFSVLVLYVGAVVLMFY